jgi:hypothetical protein
MTINNSAPIAKTFHILMLTTALALPLSLMTTKSVLAEDLVFKVINKTDTNLVKFQTSPTGVNDWEEDILGTDTLKSGESVNINIKDGETVCTYDIRGVFDDGEEVLEYKVNLCTLGSYTFHNK